MIEKINFLKKNLKKLLTSKTKNVIINITKGRKLIKMEMELVVTKTLWIPLEEIIEENKLTRNSSDSEIMDAVENYVSELDSCEYDLIGETDKEKIKKF